MLVGIGLYMTYVTGRLNVCSTANLEYGCFYIEPWIYMTILVVDYF